MSMGARTDAIKLAMAGTQDWWCQFPPLLGTDSILLERVELSDSFNGGLFRALTNFTPVVPVNNTLLRCIRPASSWPHDSLS